MANKPKLLFDNRLADAAIAASSTAVGFAAANVADWRAYTWWKPTALPATLTVDCGSAKSADYALVYGHDLFAKGCTVEIRGSTNNFSGSDVLVASKTPTSDDPFLLLFNAVSYRYWRIRITGSAAPSLAIAAIGAAFNLPTFFPQEFDPLGRKGVGRRNQNTNGMPLGAVYDYEEWSEKIELQRVSWSWLRATFLPAWEAHLRSSPFVLAWESAGYPDELRLVTVKGQFKTPHYSGSTADLMFDVVGVVS